MREPETSSLPETLCDLPEDAIPVAVVEVCEYLDSDGRTMVVVRASRGNVSSVLGMMELGKYYLLKGAEEDGLPGEM
jgi:hypothetical protein